MSAFDVTRIIQCASCSAELWVDNAAPLAVQEAAIIGEGWHPYSEGYRGDDGGIIYSYLCPPCDGNPSGAECDA